MIVSSHQNRYSSYSLPLDNYSINRYRWQIAQCIRVSVKVDYIQLLWYTGFSVIDAIPRSNIVAIMEL